MHEQSSHAAFAIRHFIHRAVCISLHSHRNERLHDYLLILFLRILLSSWYKEHGLLATTILHRQVGDARALGRDDSQRFCHIFGFHAGDVVPVENDFSGITPVQTGYGAEQRRFSCPVSSDKACQLTFFYSLAFTSWSNEFSL